MNLLDSPVTVNSAVGYLFKFHIKTISGKGEVDREEKRERERKSWQQLRADCRVCRPNISRLTEGELLFGWAAYSIGIIVLCLMQSVETIMIFASSIATLKGKRRENEM